MEKEFAQRLRTARGLESQTSLAQRSGVSDRTISLLENGKARGKTSAETVIRLALATGQDEDEWLAVLGIASDSRLHVIREMVLPPLTLDEEKVALQYLEEIGASQGDLRRLDTDRNFALQLFQRATSGAPR